MKQIEIKVKGSNPNHSNNVAHVIKRFVISNFIKKGQKSKFSALPLLIVLCVQYKIEKDNVRNFHNISLWSNGKSFKVNR